MFYVKSQINEDAYIKIDITDENVFCTCPKCGSEVLVDLAEVFQNEEIDLFGTDVYCTECSKGIRSYE